MRAARAESGRKSAAQTAGPLCPGRKPQDWPLLVRSSRLISASLVQPLASRISIPVPIAIGPDCAQCSVLAVSSQQ